MSRYNPMNACILVIIALIGISILSYIHLYLIPVFLMIIVGYGLYRLFLLNSVKKNFGFLGNEEDNIKYILILTAYLTKADKRVSTIEKEFVLQQLKDDFKENYAKRYYELYISFLSKKININRVCISIRENFDLPGKLQLLHFLIGLILSDGVLTKEEEFKIAFIAKKIGIPSKSLNAIFKLFSFKRDYNSNNQKGSSQKNTPHKSNKSSLQNAYVILSLTENDSDEMVKKAYRKMAKLHHPDKVAHLGKSFEKKAKEKFQQILDAYELIKQKREFK